MNTFFKRRRSSLYWVLSGLVLSIVFIAVSIPGVSAQNFNQERSYHMLIQNVFDFIQRNYVDEVNAQELFEGAMKGMLDSLGDPNSAFLPAKEFEDLTDTTSGSFGGVGLYIGKPLEARPDGTPPFIEVSSPIEGTPGWRAGINPGDLIIAIDGVPTDILSSDEAVARLRGVPGTSVELLIRRGPRLEFPVTLTRAIIEVPVIRYEMIDDIAYLRIITFTPMTVTRTREALMGFRQNNLKGIILDLRNNPGGVLEAAVGVCELFLDGGVVVSTRSRIPAENRSYTAGRRSVVPQDIPVIVLINRGSASASEIVAGALKDRGRAFLVGERTFGKGSVQRVFPMGSNAGFRITTARYQTPSNADIDNVGIPPDREVLVPEFSAQDADKLRELIASNAIPVFVEQNPNATRAQTDTFARQLYSEYGLELTLLQRLIRNEQNRTQLTPAYDLDYDVQLQEAVNIIRNENFSQLMENTKTLKALQEEMNSELLLAS